MILADVGNSYLHLLKDGEIINLKIDDAIKEYANSKIFYICVNLDAKELIDSNSSWQDISSHILLSGAYEGMGIDRKALCLSRGDGLYIDAGSALTLDRVEGGVYNGGMILPGLYSYKRALADISTVLDKEPLWDTSLKTLPKGTREQLSYGIIAPIYREISYLRNGLPLYITGGDGKIIASWFEEALFDEMLVFEGMKKALLGAIS